MPFQALNRLSWLSPFSKAFLKIAALQNFIATPLTLQVWPTVQFLTILTNSYCNIFWTTSDAEFFRTIFQSLFEDTTITNKFLKCNTSCIEINTLFTIFNNKELGNCKVRPSYSIFRGMDAGQWKVFPNKNVIKLVMQSYQIKWLLSRNNCS